MKYGKILKAMNGLYQVSNFGNVISLITNKRRKFNIRNGYVLVNLYKDKKMKNKLVHRIVAEAFIPNLKNKPEVNHINGVKSDNRVENLEWCTSKDNIKHSYKALGRKGVGGNKGNINKITKTTKPLIQYDLNGNFIKVWASKENASRELKIDSASISNCCRGKRNSIGGFKWKYVEDEIIILYKQIDLMAEQLGGLAIFDEDIESPLILGDKQEVKEYFRKKVENE